MSARRTVRRRAAPGATASPTLPGEDASKNEPEPDAKPANPEHAGARPSDPPIAREVVNAVAAAVDAVLAEVDAAGGFTAPVTVEDCAQVRDMIRELIVDPAVRPAVRLEVFYRGATAHVNAHVGVVRIIGRELPIAPEPE